MRFDYNEYATGYVVFGGKIKHPQLNIPTTYINLPAVGTYFYTS